MNGFKTIAPQDRPILEVAFWYRWLISRETLIAFQKTYDEIVNTILTCQDEDERWKFMRSMFDFDDYVDTFPINAANLPVTFEEFKRLMSYCVEFSGKFLYSHSHSLEQGELMTTIRKC